MTKLRAFALFCLALALFAVAAPSDAAGNLPVVPVPGILATRGLRRNVVRAPAAYAVQPGDELVSVTVLPATVFLPSPSVSSAGDTYEIVDEVGTAGASAITVNGNGANVNGAATLAINNNFGVVRFVFNSSSTWDAFVGAAAGTTSVQRLNGDFTTTSATAVATGLSYAIGANETWIGRFDVTSVTTAGATDKASWSIAAPVGATVEGFLTTMRPDGSLLSDTHVTAPSTLVTPTTTSPNGTSLRVTIVYSVKNGATPGTVGLSAAINTGTNVTVKAGSSSTAAIGSSL